MPDHDWPNRAEFSVVLELSQGGPEYTSNTTMAEAVQDAVQNHHFDDHEVYVSTPDAEPYTGEDVELICDALTVLWQQAPARREDIKTLIERHVELSLVGDGYEGESEPA